MRALPDNSDVVTAGPCAIKAMVTVIIPTYNAGERFARVLKSLQNQTVKPCKIFVVDSESTDGTIELAKKHNCRIINIKRADFGHGKTRNFAASKSQTEFLLFLTQDAVATSENMISELIKPMLANHSIAMCYGRQLPNSNTCALECLARQFNYPPTSLLKTKDQLNETGLKTFFCSNSCSAIRYSAFEKLGRFDDNAITNEDMLFGAKAILQGYSIYYAAKAKVYHSHSYSVFAVFRRYFKIGRFFADNKWLLRYATLHGYGLRSLKFGIHEYWRRRRILDISILLIDLATKTIACNLGRCYQQLGHSRNGAGKKT
jgi:rhamnosyltransferase